MSHSFESSMSLAKLSAIRQMLLNKSGLVRSVSIRSLSSRRVGDSLAHVCAFGLVAYIEHEIFSVCHRF